MSNLNYLDKRHLLMLITDNRNLMDKYGTIWNIINFQRVIKKYKIYSEFKETVNTGVIMLFDFQALNFW